MRTRILFFHQVGARGGAATMLTNIIAELDKKCFEAVVVCPPGDVIQDFEAVGAEVRIAPRPIYQFQHISGYSKSFVHPRFLHDTLRQWKDRNFWCDYIHESGAKIVHLNAVTLAPLAWSARKAGAKVACLVQETAVHGLVGLRTAWLRHILTKWMDAVVFISEYDKRQWRCDAPFVAVVPNWVDLKKFDKTVSQSIARQTMGFPANARLLLFMGGISHLKGTLPLLKAMTLLSDIENLLLIIAGYSSATDMSGISTLQRIHMTMRHLLGLVYHRQVFDFISRHKLKNRVRFIGMIDDVVPLYSASDIVVFPAVSPHQARPVLEAGAMGKPVVVSDFTNLHEFVKHEQTGLTVPCMDKDALARAIRQILNDPSLARRLANGNYMMALEKHNRDINAPKFTAIYHRLAIL